MSIGAVDSTFQMEPDVWDYRSAKINVEVFSELADENQQKYNSYKGLVSDYFVTERKYLIEDVVRYLDSVQIYQAVMDSFMVDFKPYFIGW